LIKNQRLLF